ncbi:MAG: DUF2384 domain-containing protein [Gammaproteobacteria bacterium]|nr:DUF2384 domain-containing protein [Gammaproteobacteria bacterium]
MPIAKDSARDPRQVLYKALINAGKMLGLSQTEVSDVIGRNRSSLSRGLDPDSKAGELALMLIRCYRSLYVLVGGRAEDMQHWMRTGNLHTGGVPAEQIRQVEGLAAVLRYLDAMRGKT